MQRLLLALLIAASIRHVSVAAEVTHFAGGVKVTRGGLVHTGQFYGRNSDSGDFGAGDAIAQLQQLCESYGATLADVAKLNCYLGGDSPDMAAALQTVLNQTWMEGKQPAVTTVPTALPGGAKVAFDAVVAIDSSENNVTNLGRSAALMPANRDALYVSGRAAPGELSEATFATLNELFAVLAHFGSQPKDVVQVKAFIKPMSEWETVATRIAQSFGNSAVPPIVYVEWSSKSRATEIELIAVAPDQSETDNTVSFFTPPGDKASPVFSRVARVHGDEIIYIGGIAGPDNSSPESEVRSLFKALQETSDVAATDFQHFAKAVYYVSDDDVSASLNKLRPEYYHSKRPPAASKVQVPSIGIVGRGLLIDMVATPVLQE